MTNIRQERVARLLFEELSIIISSELSDPKLSLVRVTDVIISRDLRNAKVYVCHDEDAVTRNEVLQRLKRALPYMRSEIAVRCGLRSAPELLFYYDETPERAERIDVLFQQIADERQVDGMEGPDVAADSAMAESAEADTSTDSNSETGA